MKPLAAPSRRSRARLARGLAALLLSTVALAATGALGCGGTQRDEEVASPSTHGPQRLPALHERDDADPSQPSGVVHWEAKLTEEAPGLLDEFARRASRYGCETRADDDWVLARCAEAPIKMIKRGRTVSVACRGVSLQDCRDLFGRIVDVAKETPGGQGPRMW